MSDKERNTYYDSLSETGSPPAGSDEKCPYCGIYKIMAESRLFEVPETLGDPFEEWKDPNQWHPFLGYLSPPYINHYRLEKGSNKGCQFCGLLLDAISTWENGKGIDRSISTISWSLERRQGQFLIRLTSYGVDATPVEIFRGTGMCFHQLCKGRS
jgi:hypothetical protein